MLLNLNYLQQFTVCTLISCIGPWRWNGLPAELHQPDVEIGQFIVFRRLLKMFLFEWDCGT